MNNYNPFSLEGKTIFVTGASSGIGKVTAIECSRMGAQLIITGRNEDRLKDTLQNLVGSGHQMIAEDLSECENIERLVSALPNINGFVCNAGYGVLQLIPFIKEADMKTMFKVNIEAPIFLTHLLVKKKKLHKNSSVVYTSSISAKGVCSLGNSLYTSTKGALTSFMKNAALDLASKQIRCNAVMPGMVETPMKDGKSSITAEQWEINRQLYPLKRFGNPQDVAWAIIYLLSDASQWMTGSELVIDGGRSLK